MTTPAGEQKDAYDEIDLLDYLQVIVKRRRMIIRNALYAGIFMAVVSLILPSTYTATTTLLPPEDNDHSGLSGMLPDAAIPFINMPGLGGNSSDMFVEILKSRTVARAVLKKTYKYAGTQADLYTIWDENSRENAVKKLARKSMFSANEQGIIQISVEMHDANLAAQVANTFVAELDSVNQAKSLSKAKSSRLYIESQLQQTESSLKDASQQLARFQEKYKAVNLEEQTRVSIERAGEIKGTIMAKEVELEVARQTMKPDNPVVLHLQKELDELQSQYEQLQFGDTGQNPQKDYFIPFSDVPEVGLRYAELIREVKVQETVWQLLNQQYYSTKIQEARDTPTVQVLDEAVPPEKRTSPKRTLLVLVAAFLSGTFSIFWAFVLEYREKTRNSEQETKLNSMAAALKQDYLEITSLLKTWLSRIRKTNKQTSNPDSENRNS